MVMVAGRLGPRWRPLALLATYLEIAAFDHARVGADPPCGQQLAQDVPADRADQVDDGVGDHPGGGDELISGSV